MFSDGRAVLRWRLPCSCQWGDVSQAIETGCGPRQTVSVPFAIALAIAAPIIDACALGA
jgi:hypothetical protein